MSETYLNNKLKVLKKENQELKQLLKDSESKVKQLIEDTKEENKVLWSMLDQAIPQFKQKSNLSASTMSNSFSDKAVQVNSENTQSLDELESILDFLESQVNKTQTDSSQEAFLSHQIFKSQSEVSKLESHTAFLRKTLREAQNEYDALARHLTYEDCPSVFSLLE